MENRSPLGDYVVPAPITDMWQCQNISTGRVNKILDLLSGMLLYGKVLYLLFPKHSELFLKHSKSKQAKQKVEDFVIPPIVNLWAIPFEILRGGRNGKICRPSPHILNFADLPPHIQINYPFRPLSGSRME